MKIKSLLDDIQLLFLAVILHNSWSVLDDGFSWLGLGVLVSGTLFCILLLISKHMHYSQKEEKVTTE